MGEPCPRRSGRGRGREEGASPRWLPAPGPSGRCPSPPTASRTSGPSPPSPSSRPSASRCPPLPLAPDGRSVFRSFRPDSVAPKADRVEWNCVTLGQCWDFSKKNTGKTPRNHPTRIVVGFWTQLFVHTLEARAHTHMALFNYSLFCFFLFIFKPCCLHDAHTPPKL